MSYVVRTRRRFEWLAAPEPQGRSSPAATTSTGPRASARSVEAARTPGSTSPSSAATRCSGRPAGRTSSRRDQYALSDRGRLTRTPTSTRRSTLRIRRVTTPTWRDPRFSPPGDAGRPENSLSGQIFLVNAGTSDIKVPATFSKLRFWRNTAVSTLTSGQTLTLGAGTGTLGYEWDVDPDNGFRPPGRIPLSSTTVTGPADVHRLRHRGRRQHHRHPQPLALPSPQRRPGLRRRHRAVVLGSGHNQRLEQRPTNPTPPTRTPTMQQATVNLMADMGAQPATLQSGLIATPQVDRHDGAHRDRQLALVGGRVAHRRQHRSTDLRHRIRCRRRERRRGRGLHGRRLDLAHGERDQLLDLLVERPRRPLDDGQGPGGRRLGQHRRRHRGHAGHRQLPLHDLRRHGPRDRATPNDTGSLEVGVKFRSDLPGTDQRDPLLQERGQHGHPCRQPLEEQTAPCWPRRPSAARPPRLAEGQLLEPGDDPAEHHLRGGLLRAERPLLTAQEYAIDRPARRSGRDILDSPPLHVLPDHRRTATASTNTPSASTFPTEHLPVGELLGRRAVHPDGPATAPGQVTNVSATAGALAGNGQLDRRRRRRAR